MQLDLNKLHVFLEAARTGNYTAAAQHLHVTQSAVSHAIRKLETSVDLPLVEWRARRLCLTDQGEYLYRVCERVFRDLEDAEQRLAERSQQVAYTVVLGATVEFGTTVLVRRIRPLLERHPGLHVDFRFHHDLVQPLLRDELDLAVDCTPHLHPSVQETPLLRETYVVVASPAFLAHNPVHAPRDLERYPVLSMDKRGDWWAHLLEALPPRERPALGRVIQINHVRGIINAALDGMGVGLVPMYTVLRALADGTLVALFPDLELLEDRFCIYQKRSRADREKNQRVTRFLLGLREQDIA